jgi:hypothetical protein
LTRSTTTPFRSLRHGRTWCCTFYENVYRRSLFRPPFCELLRARNGPQGPRRPRFSFFRFTCQTTRTRESVRTEVPTPYGDAGEPSKPALRPRSGGWFTEVIDEELRGRVISPKGGGAPCWGVYRRHLRPLSTALRENLMTVKFSASHKDLWPVDRVRRGSALPCGSPLRRTAATLSGRCSGSAKQPDEGQ